MLPAVNLHSMNAQYWIEKLDLLPHPEGGFYREVYRCRESCDASGLPVRFGADRAFSTAIYFLLQAGDFSAFHRIKSDEIWHHYDGGDLEILVIHPNGDLECLLLGKQQPEARPMLVVPYNAWFAARLCHGDGYVLCGCTVAPGFDFADFEMAARAELVRHFPQHAGVIGILARG
jgi:predicted cupin superfamily sugar epimerase